jgi:hypothetical protein
MGFSNWVIATFLMWLIYSTLTIYGAFKFPLYSGFDKVKAAMLTLFIPFIGAYLVNYDMGYRLNNGSKETLLIELPWWASIGINSKRLPNNDDD